MVEKTSILKNLNQLNRLYIESKRPEQNLFYAKLAILELCGWIEESMDDIICRCSSRHLKDVSNKNYVEKNIVKSTYGFDYAKHFRKMLIQLIGLVNVEKLERRVNSVKFAKLKATLRSFKKYRDEEAHTHIKGNLKTLDAPSVTKKNFVIIYDGIKDFEKNIRKMKL